MGDTRARIALFDNVKGVLIALVVVGHFMHPVHNDNEALSALFDIIYLFHMPLFVFVSGLFAKGAYRDGRLNVNRIVSFVVLGFAYQVALTAINGVLDEPERLWRFSSAPWYLIGMAWWYLATPLLARVAPGIGISACLAASLLWGCVDVSSGFLAISRSLAFLPYFAAGYYASTAQVERLAGKKVLYVAVAAAAAIFSARLVSPTCFEWFFPQVYGDNPYGPNVLAGVAAKLATIAIAAVCSLAVLRLVPRERSLITVLGERTLQVYVLHRLIRAALTFRTPFYGLPILLDPLWGTAIVLALSGGVLVLTAWRGFTRPFAALMAARWLPARRDGGA